MENHVTDRNVEQILEEQILNVYRKLNNENRAKVFDFLSSELSAEGKQEAADRAKKMSEKIRQEKS